MELRTPRVYCPCWHASRLWWTLMDANNCDSKRLASAYMPLERVCLCSCCHESLLLLLLYYEYYSD
jgi:hypothetical protein